MNPLKIVILITALFSVSQAFSQSTNVIDWAWENTYGNDSNNVANQIVVDENFDIYVSGIFQDTLVLDGDTLAVPASYPHVFLAKFDQFGDLIWSIAIDFAYTVQKIELDTNNNVHLLLNYHEIQTYSGADGAFLNSLSLLSNPTPQAEVSIDFELGNDMSTYVFSWAIMDPFAYVCRIDKFDSLNVNVWSKSFEYEGWLNSMALDADQNIYISGFFAGSWELSIVGTDIVTTYLGGSLDNTLFMAKYNDSGEAQWLDTIPINQGVAIFDTEVNSVDNSMYMTGYQSFDEVFYNDTITMDTTNQSQIFLMKYDLDGNYAWTKPFPLATKSLKTYIDASWGAYGSHLAIADNGSVYLKGGFTGSIIYMNDTLVEDTTTVVLNAVADDTFIAKLDANGNPIWGKYGGNSGGYDNQTGGFWVDTYNDVIYMVGFYAAPNNIVKSAKMLTPVNSLRQIFVGKEVGPIYVNTSSVEQLSDDDHQVLVYPNPSSGVYYVSLSPGLQQLTYSIVDLRAQVVSTGVIVNDVEEINISGLSDGIYFLQTELGSIKLLKQ